MPMKPGDEYAFPKQSGAYGMTLRDYFAGQAIERMISLSQDSDGGWSTENVAAGCYKLADAMLAERSKPSEEKP